ncbi:hypothetical protein MMMDOFMJ_0384 [Methylobacterium gnaphalii]|uniref:Uncharacterized protein n=1 Tax=Methylobacterium gnaphalii TaxID=1010610 RepID=A0A512JQR3_9HYPH|nr:hypothetical protein MGN01_40380 [Methylobacterium gnaphalii]GJD67469.1 hypothetical protein MMMDOFMJ_0384 [Methylobacterium gnaphalii]GLS51315.1 hypothetical protein GCM10007885_41700 [Methylobacterium gnaphalii]
MQKGILMRNLTLAGLGWIASFHQAFAQQTKDAPPISESGPSHATSGPAVAAAIDLNWVWVSLVVALVILGLWYVARQRQSGPPRR